MLNGYQFYLHRFSNFMQQLGVNLLRPNAVDQADNDFTIQRSFLQQLGQPQFVQVEAMSETAPVSADYNNMLSVIANDVSFLHDAAGALCQQLSSDFNFHTAALQALQSQLNVAGQSLEQSLLEEHALSDVVDIKENFANPAQFTASQLPLAQIAPYGVTLAQASNVNMSPTSSVNILIGNVVNECIGTYSNGFPGNIHEYSGGQYVGYLNDHADYAAVIDGDPSTWFEYEDVSILLGYSPQYGLNYLAPDNTEVSWDQQPSGGCLSLAMEISLPSSQTVNQIHILYCTPATGGIPSLSSIKSSADGIVPSVTVSGYTTYINASEIVVSFQPRTMKSVQLFFEQPYFYLTDVGCLYSTTAPNISISGSAQGIESDVAIPLTAINFLSNGYQARTTVQVVGLQSIMANLQQGGSVVLQSDIVAANRYMIGISSIDVSSIAYQTTSEIISPWYTFADTPAVLVLQTDDSQPTGTSIQYFISADSVVWVPIQPLGSGSGDMINVAINPLQQSASSFDGTTLVLSENFTQFQAKVVFTSTNAAVTPVLKDYDLISLPRGGAVNWL